VGTLTPATAHQVGLSRSGLYRAARDGRYERIARGIYVPVDEAGVDWDLVEAARRRRDATVCLASALAHHELTDEIPAGLDVAIPRGSRIPAGSGSIVWHSFDRDTFGVGREEVLIPGSDLRIGLYSAERSIVDAFRLRGEVGYELARDALKEWLRRGGAPARLVELALVLPRAKAPTFAALEALT